MKKLALFLISISFLACQNEKKSVHTADTTNIERPADLSFTYDSVKVYSKNVVASENVTDTSKAVISYPVFSDQKINQFIERRAVGDFLVGLIRSPHADAGFLRLVDVRKGI